MAGNVLNLTLKLVSRKSNNGAGRSPAQFDRFSGSLSARVRYRAAPCLPAGPIECRSVKCANRARRMFAPMTSDLNTATARRTNEDAAARYARPFTRL
jgi:hypothetical protein